MTTYDVYIANSIKAENKARLNYFLKHTDQIYESTKADNGAKFKDRLETLQEEIKEVFYSNFFVLILKDVFSG